MGKLLENLKTNKAPGVAKINPALLQIFHKELSKPIYIIFKKSLQKGKVPPHGRIANISPIYISMLNIEKNTIGILQIWSRTPHRPLSATDDVKQWKYGTYDRKICRQQDTVSVFEIVRMVASIMTNI